MTGDPLHLFEAERPILTALAYRMLGERAAAEDVVQEAWLRWQRHAGAVDAPRAWLRQVTTRLEFAVTEAAPPRPRTETS